MRRNNLVFKLIGFAVAWFVLVNQTIYAQPLPKLAQSPTLAESLQSIATVEAFHSPNHDNAMQALKDSSHKLLIYIQDAHGNISAQKNISATIKQISEILTLDSPWIALEGSDVGEIDHKFFSSFPDAKLKQEIALEYLKKGELDGADYFAITENPQARLFGVDDGKLARANRARYREFLAYQTEVSGILSKLSKLLNHLKNKVYTPELKRFDTFVRDFEGKPWRMQHLLNQFFKLIKDLDLDLDQYEQLRLLKQVHINQQSENQAMDGKVFLHEFEQIKTIIWDELLFYEEARDIHKLDQTIRFYKKLYEFSLTPEEHKDYLENKDFYAIDSLIKQIRHYNFIIPHEKRLSRDQYSRLEALSSYPMDFYDLVHARNEPIVENLHQVIKQNPSSKTFFVAGGFHQKDIAQELKKRSLAFLILTPSISDLSGSDNYWRLMKESTVKLASSFRSAAWVNGTRNRLQTELDERSTVSADVKSVWLQQQPTIALSEARAVVGHESGVLFEAGKPKEGLDVLSELLMQVDNPPFDRSRLQKYGASAFKIQKQIAGVEAPSQSSSFKVILDVEKNMPPSEAAPVSVGSVPKVVDGVLTIQLTLYLDFFTDCLTGICADYPEFRELLFWVSFRNYVFGESLDGEGGGETIDSGKNLYNNNHRFVGPYLEHLDNHYAKQGQLNGESLTPDQAFTTFLAEYDQRIGSRTSFLRELHKSRSRPKVPTLAALLPKLPRARTGQYKLVKKIGSGGQGVVYEAIQVATNRRVAVKPFREADFDDDNTFRLQQAEVAALSAVSNAAPRHLIEILDQEGLGPGVTHSTFRGAFLVMPLAPGEPLSKIIQDPRWTVDVTITAFLQILLGLAEAHGHKLAHRDIKPANIVADIDWDDQNIRSLKIVDFGLAKNTRNTMTTQAGVVAGTPGYISPEKVLGYSLSKEQEGLADIYAAGVVFYQLLTGTFPTKSGSPPGEIGGVVKMIQNGFPDLTAESTRFDFSAEQLLELNALLDRLSSPLIATTFPRNKGERGASEQVRAEAYAGYIAALVPMTAAVSQHSGGSQINNLNRARLNLAAEHLRGDGGEDVAPDLVRRYGQVSDAIADVSSFLQRHFGSGQTTFITLHQQTRVMPVVGAPVTDTPPGTAALSTQAAIPLQPATPRAAVPQPTPAAPRAAVPQPATAAPFDPAAVPATGALPVVAATNAPQQPVVRAPTQASRARDRQRSSRQTWLLGGIVAVFLLVVAGVIGVLYPRDDDESSGKNKDDIAQKGQKDPGNDNVEKKKVDDPVKPTVPLKPGVWQSWNGNFNNTKGFVQGSLVNKAAPASIFNRRVERDSVILESKTHYFAMLDFMGRDIELKPGEELEVEMSVEMPTDIMGGTAGIGFLQGDDQSFDLMWAANQRNYAEGVERAVYLRPRKVDVNGSRSSVLTQEIQIENIDNALSSTEWQKLSVRVSNAGVKIAIKGADGRVRYNQAYSLGGESLEKLRPVVVLYDQGKFSANASKPRSKKTVKVKDIRYRVNAPKSEMRTEAQIQISAQPASQGLVLLPLSALTRGDIRLRDFFGADQPPLRTSKILFVANSRAELRALPKDVTNMFSALDDIYGFSTTVSPVPFNALSANSDALQSLVRRSEARFGVKLGRPVLLSENPAVTAKQQTQSLSDATVVSMQLLPGFFDDPVNRFAHLVGADLLSRKTYQGMSEMRFVSGVVTVHGLIERIRGNFDRLVAIARSA